VSTNGPTAAGTGPTAPGEHTRPAAARLEPARDQPECCATCATRALGASPAPHQTCHEGRNSRHASKPRAVNRRTRRRYRDVM